MVLDIADSKLIPVKTGAGETDLQARDLCFDNYTFLKESEARSTTSRRACGTTARGAQLALYPNLNAQRQGVARAVPRRCASAARCRWRSTGTRSTRRSISASAIAGQQHGAAAEPAVQAGISRRRGAVRHRQGQRAAGRDRAERARQRRSPPAARRPPDGDRSSRPRARRREKSDVLRAGPRFVAEDRRQDRSPSRRSARSSATAIFAGETLMSIWYGRRERHPDRRHEPGGVRPDQPAAAAMAEMGPVSSRPRAPPASRRIMPEAQRLHELFHAWRGRREPTSSAAIWHEILEIWAEQVYTIGIIAGVLQPVVGPRQAAQRAGESGLQLGSRRAVRHVPAGHLLVRQGRLSAGGPLGRRRAAAISGAQRVGRARAELAQDRGRGQAAEPAARRRAADRGSGRRAGRRRRGRRRRCCRPRARPAPRRPDRSCRRDTSTEPSAPQVSAATATWPRTCSIACSSSLALVEAADLGLVGDQDVDVLGDQVGGTRRASGRRRTDRTASARPWRPWRCAICAAFRQAALASGRSHR